MVIPIEMLEKTNIKQHQTMESKINEIVDVVNSQGLETIKDTVNDVKARVGVLENESDTQDTEISQLGTRVSAVEKKNSTQDTQITEVTARVTAVESKNTSQDQAITALENDKADTADVTALANRVTAVETKNASQDQAITTLENDKADTADVTALANRVTAVESKNTSQDQAITALENDKADTAVVTALGDRVTAVENEIDNINVPDIAFSGPFLTGLNINESSGNVVFDFTAKKLDGSPKYSYITFPHATDTVDGTVKLNEVVLKNQGTDNAGKALVVGSDGMVTPGDAGGGGGTAITTFQFNGPNFDDFKEWVTSTAPYKQFSGKFNAGIGDHSLSLSMGGFGLMLSGGGLYSRPSSDEPLRNYPISECRFEVVDNDNIRVTIFYAGQDGTPSNINFNMNRARSSFFGSAFIIN